MNMKTVYLQSKIRENCRNARQYVREGCPLNAFHALGLALAHARQMPDCPKWRAQRAWIVLAMGAIKV